MKRFFKYYRFDKYGLYAINNNSLWLSNPQYFNDPYDSNLNFLIDKEIQDDRAFRVSGMQEVRNNLGVCCFTSRWDDALMWKDYANNHTGFCTEYDLEAIEAFLNRTGLPMIFEPVTYVDHPYSNTDSNLPKHLEERLQRQSFLGLDAKRIDSLTQGLILTKDKKLWAHENESRLIVPAVLIDRILGNPHIITKEAKGYTLRLPKGCIKAIYMGVKSNQSDVINALDALKFGKQGYVETRWVKLGPVRGELVADTKSDTEISDILSGCRIYGEK